MFLSFRAAMFVRKHHVWAGLPSGSLVVYWSEHGKGRGQYMCCRWYRETLSLRCNGDDFGKITLYIVFLMIETEYKNSTDGFMNAEFSFTQMNSFFFSYYIYLVLFPLTPQMSVLKRQLQPLHTGLKEKKKWSDLSPGKLWDNRCSCNKKTTGQILWDLHLRWWILDYSVFLRQVVPCVFTGLARRYGGGKSRSTWKRVDYPW